MQLLNGPIWASAPTGPWRIRTALQILNAKLELAVHKPENVNRNFRILGPVPVGNAVAKIGRFMYNTEKDYVALRLLNRRDSYQKERQI